KGLETNYHVTIYKPALYSRRTPVIEICVAHDEIPLAFNVIRRKKCTVAVVLRWNQRLRAPQILLVRFASCRIDGDRTHALPRIESHDVQCRSHSEKHGVGLRNLHRGDNRRGGFGSWRYGARRTSRARGQRRSRSRPDRSFRV